MEIYINLSIDGKSYFVAVKATGRKVKWCKAFEKTEDSILLNEIRIKKITASTWTQELQYWLGRLKGNLKRKHNWD